MELVEVVLLLQRQEVLRVNLLEARGDILAIELSTNFHESFVSTFNLYLQGVPYYWAHFVFVIISGSRAHTEELFIAIR